MSKWFSKPEPKSWSGETASDQKEPSKSDLCANGHLLVFRCYEWATIYGKDVRYRVYDCVRGCGHVEKNMD